MENVYKTFFEAIGAKLDDRKIRPADEVLTEISAVYDFVKHLEANHVHVDG